MKATRKNRKAKAKKKANKKINEANHERKRFMKVFTDNFKIETTEVTKDNLEDVLNVFAPFTSHYIDVTDQLIEELCSQNEHLKKDQLIDLKNKGWKYDEKRESFVAPPKNDDFEIYGFDNF